MSGMAADRVLAKRPTLRLFDDGRIADHAFKKHHVFDTLWTFYRCGVDYRKSKRTIYEKVIGRSETF